ncbi:MAG TPA: TolC family protein [Tepidisphaeraceae bacterium]
MMMEKYWGSLAATLLVCVVAGCAASGERVEKAPRVAPATQPSASLDLGGPRIAPMYSRLLAIDLPTVARVATLQNLDIQRARQQVEANRGRYERNIEAIFPVIAPSIAYNHFQGVGQNANGTLTTPVHFDNLLPAVSIQWVLNPGMVVYDIIASKRRLEAAGLQEHSTRLDAIRSASVQYYDLVLAQAQLHVADRAAKEAEELLRITQLRVRTGTGLPADELRAQAQLGGFQQDEVLALNGFYQASVALTLTLHLDPVITLVPAGTTIDQVMLVRDDLSIERLLELALAYRPDLQSARALLGAVQADTGATVWGGFGPQVQAGFTTDEIKTTVAGHHYGWNEQQKDGVGASFALGLTAFGNLKTAQASQRSAMIDVQRQLDLTRSAVVSAQQNSAANAKLIPIARQQFEAAQEALRLTQANLQAGTALLVDVLLAENAAADARLRYVSAVIHYDQSQVNLLAAVGLLDETSESLGDASTRPSTGPTSQP